MTAKVCHVSVYVTVYNMFSWSDTLFHQCWQSEENIIVRIISYDFIRNTTISSRDLGAPQVGQFWMCRLFVSHLWPVCISTGIWRTRRLLLVDKLKLKPQYRLVKLFSWPGLALVCGLSAACHLECALHFIAGYNYSFISIGTLCCLFARPLSVTSTTC